MPSSGGISKRPLVVAFVHLARIAFRPFRFKRKRRVIELGVLSEKWLASERAQREDKA